MRTVLLLVASNAFMTLAWYGHLKYPKTALLGTIVISWLIALPEYALQVPANRIGYRDHGLTATQLKIIQEVISLTVFALFAFFYFKEAPTWRVIAAFVLIVAAVFFALPDAFGASPRPATQKGPGTNEVDARPLPISDAPVSAASAEQERRGPQPS
jgi:uncharacterized protein (DUF486 family)